MAPQNEVSIEIAVKYTEVQTSAYSVAPQSELKGPTEGSYGFISFLKHTFCDLYFPIFKKGLCCSMLSILLKSKVE